MIAAVWFFVLAVLTGVGLAALLIAGDIWLNRRRGRV